MRGVFKNDTVYINKYRVISLRECVLHTLVHGIRYRIACIKEVSVSGKI